ncbi:MAG: cation:proton antiporter [Fibrobacteria bacterium]|nr:cation:proton antiporter [Fibrobacteria bacterium]
MHGEDFFIQAFMYLAAAVIAVPIAKRLGLGSVLGYLIAGVIMGPFILNLIGKEGQDVMHFAEFGVVMMLFLIGLELEPRHLWRLRSSIIGMGGGQMFITSTVVTVIGIIAGLKWQASLAIGMILSVSSTAVVLQSLEERDLRKTDGGQKSFAVLLFQDMAVIPILAVIPLLALAVTTGHESHAVSVDSSWVSGMAAWLQTIVVLSVVAGIILAGRFLARPILRIIAQTRLRELFTAASLLLVIAIALLTTKVGLSPALGTFLAGVILANSEYRHELVGNIEPFKGLLMGLFFIAVGASIDFTYIIDHPLLLILLTLSLMAGKFIILFILGKIFKLSFDQNMIFSLALAQGGEFAFLLFSFALHKSVLTEAITKPLMVVVAISMAITPILLLLNEKFLQPRLGTREKEGRQADSFQEENSVIIAGFGRFGSIVGRLLRAHGVGLTILDHDSNSVDMLRKLGFRVFYGDASRLDLLEAAGISTAKLLIIAIDEPEQAREIVAIAQKHYPRLTIMSRANGQQDAYELIESGIKNVYRETFETSLCMGREALRFLGFRAHQAHRASMLFRRQDQRHLHELVDTRHERKTYLTATRQKIEDLERQLRQEAESYDEQLDKSWDVDSLRRAAKER